MGSAALPPLWPGSMPMVSAGQRGGGRARVGPLAGGLASACGRGRRRGGGPRRRAQCVAGAASRQGRADAGHDRQAARGRASQSGARADQSPTLPFRTRGKSLRDGVPRTRWMPQPPRDATLPGPGTLLAAQSRGGSSPDATAPAGAVCCLGSRGGRGRAATAGAGGDHGRGAAAAAPFPSHVTVTRHMISATSEPCPIRRESGRRWGLAAVLRGRACCAQNAIRTTRRSVNSAACAAFRSGRPGPGNRGQPGVPRYWYGSGQARAGQAYSGRPAAGADGGVGNSATIVNALLAIRHAVQFLF